MSKKSIRFFDDREVRAVWDEEHSVMHGEKAHSRYFGEAAYQYMVEGKAEGYNVVGKPNPNPENKELLIIPGASHCDLYDGGYTELVGKGEPKNLIPWDKLADFFNKNLK